MTRPTPIATPSDLETLIRHVFRFLFDQYGFEVVIVREAAKSQYRGFEVAAESSIRAAFLYEEPSVGAVMLGSPQDDFQTIGSWVDARRFIDFIEGRPLQWKKPHVARVDYVRRVFSSLATEIRSHMPLIMDMFQSQEKVAGWKAAFDEYVRSELARQYGLKHDG